MNQYIKDPKNPKITNLIITRRNGDKVVVLIDTSFVRTAKKFVWFLTKATNRQTYYVNTHISRRIVGIHTMICPCPEGKEVDHINRDTLDNRKSNLRPLTHARNILNGPVRRNNTSGYSGVFYRKDTKKWSAHIRIDKRAIRLGCYDNKLEATRIVEDVRQKFLNGCSIEDIQDSIKYPGRLRDEIIKILKQAKAPLKLEEIVKQASKESTSNVLDNIRTVAVRILAKSPEVVKVKFGHYQYVGS